jgi:hypothetical protein
MVKTGAVRPFRKTSSATGGLTRSWTTCPTKGTVVAGFGPRATVDGPYDTSGAPSSRTATDGSAPSPTSAAGRSRGPPSAGRSTIRRVGPTPPGSRGATARSRGGCPGTSSAVRSAASRRRRNRAPARWEAAGQLRTGTKPSRQLRSATRAVGAIATADIEPVVGSQVPPHLGCRPRVPGRAEFREVHGKVVPWEVLQGWIRDADLQASFNGTVDASARAAGRFDEILGRMPEGDRRAGALAISWTLPVGSEVRDGQPVTMAADADLLSRRRKGVTST